MFSLPESQQKIFFCNFPPTHQSVSQSESFKKDRHLCQMTKVLELVLQVKSKRQLSTLCSRHLMCRIKCVITFAGDSVKGWPGSPCQGVTSEWAWMWNSCCDWQSSAHSLTGSSEACRHPQMTDKPWPCCSAPCSSCPCWICSCQNILDRVDHHRGIPLALGLAAHLESRPTGPLLALQPVNKFVFSNVGFYLLKYHQGKPLKLGVVLCQY